MKGLVKQSDEVYFAGPGLLRLSRSDLSELKALLERSGRSRIRLCAHRSPDEKAHEMFIAMRGDAYVRPHRHRTKPESFLVLEGAVDVVFFDDAGRPAEVVRLGDQASGKTFYYRISEPTYHTLLIRSKLLVFVEVAAGPYDRSDSEFAPWAPAASDSDEGREYLRRLDAEVRRLP